MDKDPNKRIPDKLYIVRNDKLTAAKASLVIVANDGTMWERNYSTNFEWIKIHDLPQN